MKGCVRAVVVLCTLGVGSHQAEAFLSGGSRVSRAAEGKPNSAVDEITTGPSSTTETIPVGSPMDAMFAEAEPTALQARAIALEAANSKTVPKATAIEALHCLARSSEMDLEQGSAAPVPLESMDGVWRLCFKEGEFLDGIHVDKHGYLPRGQEVEILFDSEDAKIVLGSRGLKPSLPSPALQRGRLEYAPETQTITGTFGEEPTGLDTLVMQACLVDDDALGFHTVSEDKEHAFLLFQADKSKGAKTRLSRVPSASRSPSSADSEAERAATVRVAGKTLLDLKRAIELTTGEETHEDKRLKVQETGRNTGSFDTFIRYLETEGATIYAVLAGPVLFSYMQRYSHIAATKATAAAIVMVETVKHLLRG